MNKNLKITGGIYLVLNPAADLELLCNKLEAALTAGIQAVQIWNNWPPETDKLAYIEKLGQRCQTHHVPLLINENWLLLKQSPYLQGVHFDEIPADFEHIKQTLGQAFIAGITCTDELGNLHWAMANQLDYISFCAMYPSPSAGSCSRVMPATVQQARRLTQMPLFVSGGITPQNILTLKQNTPFDGVAVISGILSAENPQQKVLEYKHALGI